MSPTMDGCAVGIDPGERWVGVARAALGSTLALPVGTLDRSAGDAATVQALRDLLGGEQVSALVIGVPFRVDGREDAQARAFREFGEELASALGARCVAQDERFSSHFDSQFSLEGTTDRGRKARSPGRRSVQRQRRDRERSHAAAAARILQRWLDSEEGSRAQARVNAEI
ncbi:MAG: RuvX/YqgF family protein [Chloroflexi bacterium]|nr:RuvX/YqgF family protein [Chloroflexota bacterium]